ncbi:MAG TPA: cupredoxin domain-containing protein, partial [Acidimicrobiales bacterium]|nr:cupredoxin domain-containing protein [Acidimicrobiales bacterium]
MNGLELGVLAAAPVVTAALLWFFFGPKKAQQAVVKDGVQEIDIVVKGSYSPDVIRVTKGVPLRLVFDRQERGECTSRVVFPDFGVTHALPAFTTTAVEFVPDRTGTFGFACGMNMVHGTLLVEDDGAALEGGGGEHHHVHPDGDTGGAAAPVPRPPQGSPRDTEAEDRHAEIADLTRRVIVGAVFTVPVLVATMAVDLFEATWVPDLLMERWFQLAL